MGGRVTIARNSGGMKKRLSREERLRRLTDLVRGGAVEGNAAGAP